VGRGERVLRGLWRLRLPVSVPGVPHCNAWAMSAGDGLVLVDCGMGEAGSLREFERAMDQVGLAPEDIRLLVCTHAHVDHAGLAATLQERTGCELWLHPRHEHALADPEDREAVLRQRMELARQSGVPEAPLQRWAESRRSEPSGFSGPLAPDRELVEGVTVETDLGAWTAYETPGHAPSHVVLHQPERRLLLSGDHVLGRIALYFDHGWTPDPVGEFLASLDVVERLDVRLTLAGHARPFTDLAGHIEANRALVARRLDGVLSALRAQPERTAHDLLPAVYGDEYTPWKHAWLLTKMLCYLQHLERLERIRGLAGEPTRWVLAAGGGGAPPAGSPPDRP